MFTITDRPEENQTTASLFERAVKIAGLTMAPFDPSTVGAPDFTAPTAAEVSAAAYEAALDGKDPSTDKGVQKILTSHLLGTVIGGFHYRNQVALSRAKLAHYQSEAPTLLEELATRFEDATQTMRHALELVGHVSLQDQARNLYTLNDDQNEAVFAATMADRKTRPMLDALPFIVAATGDPFESRAKHKTLMYADATFEQFNEHRLDGESMRNNYGREHSVWDVLGAGVDVELATTKAELDARIHRIEHPEAPRDLNGEQARRDDARAMAQALGIN
ncbi:hypothetical protein E8P82_14720 [Arthrobacter echini]|uniref:Uncharacterized protein n=1 Tax=Arthrobacter echini TaxID=1529066 RepID=A0A4S5DZY8_9MICC|nr:hypothetical protein [Arthrobacter echini]THJ64587.1 hypothetical protein E8P82_14720 [Arthrobacter echini]